VASVASKGALFILTVALAALAALVATALFNYHAEVGALLGVTVGGFLGWLFSFVAFDAANWWHWLLSVIGAFALIVLIWYVRHQVKFAPKANPTRWWRTLSISFGRMSFEDRSLNDNVRYARHAISIDENRKAFPRVPWGDPASSRPYQDEQGVITFRQYWFAGNHSDIGGSYPETESRLSDIALSWMVDAATGIKDGLKVDRSVIQLYPSADGMQHDQRRSGFPILTRWTRLTWPEGPRLIRDPKTTLHDSVYERYKLPSVVHYDAARPYRPEALRKHERLMDYYKDIPEPTLRNRIMGYLRSYFLVK